MTTTNAAPFSSTNVPARGARVTFSDRGVRRSGRVAAFNYYFETCDAVYIDVDGGAVLQLAWFATQDVRPEGA